MNAKRSEKVGYRKATIALVGALSCLLIYVLACVLSAPTWSPDSSRIAILVTPPGDDPNMFALFAYDIQSGERVLLDELEEDGILSGPAWSPDGKWVAYYRVEPSLPAPTDQLAQPHLATEPNMAADTAAKGTAYAPGPAEPVEKLFSEKNKMLPPFLFDVAKQQIEEMEASETSSIKLMAVTPDGKERKTLRTIQWAGSDDDLKMLMLMRPEWSADSKRLFYARAIEDNFYIGSLNLTTGEMCAHGLDALGTPATSPDGSWMASLAPSGSKPVVLSVTRTDGSAQKYFKLDLEMDEDDSAELILTMQLAWSPDSKYILVSPGKEFCVVDATTGQVRRYRDPDAEDVAYGAFSEKGQKVYYLAGYKIDGPDPEEQKVVFKSLDLQNGKTQTVFAMSEIPGLQGFGRFSISPDGKAFLFRCLIEDEQGDEASALLFWDGKTHKIVRTDRWLLKPL